MDGEERSCEKLEGKKVKERPGRSVAEFRFFVTYYSIEVQTIHTWSDYTKAGTEKVTIARDDETTEYVFSTIEFSSIKTFSFSWPKSQID